MSLRAAQAREHIRRTNSTGSFSGPDGARPAAASTRIRQAAPPPRVAARQAEVRGDGRITAAVRERQRSTSASLDRRRAASVSRERSRSTSVGSEKAQQQSMRCPPRTKSPLSSSRAAVRSGTNTVEPASASARGPAVQVQRNRGSRSTSREPQTLGRQQSPGGQRRAGSKERLAPAAVRHPVIETPAVSSRQAPPRGKHDHTDLVRLRAALEETHRQIEETLLEVSVQQWRVKESKVQQEEEIAHLSEVLESLNKENRRLQSAARGGRSATWRLQAELRSQEESIESKTEELSERQKRLAQENARLRKEAAAMKSRLLGWRQLQKRSVSPSRRAPPVKSAPVPLSREVLLELPVLREEAPRLEAPLACSPGVFFASVEKCPQPSSPAAQSTSWRSSTNATTEASTASTARSLQLSTACSTEAPPSAPPSAPTPPLKLPSSCQASEEANCEKEAGAFPMESTTDVMPGSGTTSSLSEPGTSKSPRWRTISAVAADSVGTTLSESLLRQHRADALPWSLEDLTPAAREAAEVSAMVRVRAQEALREQGLHDGESGGSSAARSRSASVRSGRSACSRSAGKEHPSPRTPQTCVTPLNWQIAWPAGWPPSNGLGSWAAGGGWTSNGRRLLGKPGDEEVMSDVALASPEHSFRGVKPGMGLECREDRHSDLNLGSW